MFDREPGPGQEPPPDDETEIASLLNEAGPRPVVPAEHLAAIRASAHTAWREKVGEPAAGAPPAVPLRFPSGVQRRSPRPRFSSWTWAAALAASVLVAVGLSWWWGRTSPDPGASSAAPVVAQVLAVAGAVEHASGTLAAGDELVAGAVITSAASGRASLRLVGGVELRLDHGTRLALRSSSEVELVAGALYADTGPAHGAALAVVTTLGTARDIGTRFAVALPAEGNLEVRVRDGAVQVSEAGGALRVSSAEELTLSATGETRRRALAPFGPEWDWVREAAPPFVTEGQDLGAMLDWAARETGWTIHFASPELAAAKASVRFQGRVELRPDRTLLAFLPSFGLEGDFLDGTLTLRERE